MDLIPPLVMVQAATMGRPPPACPTTSSTTTRPIRNRAAGRILPKEEVSANVQYKVMDLARNEIYS